MQIIIFPNDNGGVSVIYPTPDFADQIEAVAAKDVPEGKAWRIMDESDLPDRESRDRWTWTETGPLGVAADPVVVPAVVSRFQAKAALALAGKLADAEAAVAASGSVILQMAWAEANDFRRDSPGINALAPLIGLDLDALFIAAAQIEA